MTALVVALTAAAAPARAWVTVGGENVRFYYWNPKKQEREAVPQIAFMFIGGVTIKF